MSNVNARQDRSGDRAEIGARLRRARELAGLSQGQAANMMHMHRPTISEIEAGRRRVSSEELKQFAELYDASLSWLAQGAEEGDANDARYLLAARELRKMKPEDIDRLLDLLTVMRKTEDGPA